MKLSSTITASIGITALFLFVCWMGGYNFDSRGGPEGFATMSGVFLAFIPWVFYFGNR